MSSSVPIIDFSHFLQNPTHSNIFNEVADAVHLALKNVGCFYIVNHHVSEQVIKNAYDTSVKFFSLSRGVKEQYRKCTDKSTHGWVEAGQELLNENSIFELRECFDYVHPSLRHSNIPSSLTEYPQFYEAIEDFRQECNPLVKKLLLILGIALQLEDPEFFLKCSSHLEHPEVANESDFRAVYYPPIPKDVKHPKGLIRCAEHTDYKIITLLFQDEAGGLEVRSASTGNWVPATPVPNSILVIMGDLLEFWTSGYFKGTPHRVTVQQAQIPEKIPRYSFAYFIPPDSCTLIRPLQSEILKPSDTAKELKPFTAYEHIMMKCKRAYQY